MENLSDSDFLSKHKEIQCKILVGGLRLIKQVSKLCNSKPCFDNSSLFEPNYKNSNQQFQQLQLSLTVTNFYNQMIKQFS